MQFCISRYPTVTQLASPDTYSSNVSSSVEDNMFHAFMYLVNLPRTYLYVDTYTCDLFIRHLLIVYDLVLILFLIYTLQSNLDLPCLHSYCMYIFYMYVIFLILQNTKIILLHFSFVADLNKHFICL